MELDDRIKEAAGQAIHTLGLEDTSYDGQYMHQDSDLVTIHFKQVDRFSVVIELGDHPEFPANTDTDVIADQIAIKLRERPA